MKALIQRVTQARVLVDGDVVGAIDAGLLVLLGVERGDDIAAMEKMQERLVNYRVFADEQGRMNRSLLDTGGGLLLVSQFTLAADTRKGLRPGFSSAAPPDLAESLYEAMLQVLADRGVAVAAGRFGAHMEVQLTNDGPVTFLLET